MVKPTPQAGFALIELLLVALLLLLFTSAAVTNLAPLWQGARLDEGVGQLESLLRFARAEAAQQGRRLQLQVQAPADPATPGSPPVSRSAIEVSWEPEPLDQPGVFIPSQPTAALARSVTEYVRIELVRRLEPGATPAAGETGATPRAPDPGGAGSFEPTKGWPAIRFYPDGSSDSAEILVGSLDTRDPRRMLVQWNGLSGRSARQELDPDSLRLFGTEAAEAQALEPASVARTALGRSVP
jgi:type II secretory pathway pseudopilin PulG